MDDPTSLLFGLDEFTVVGVSRVAEGLVEVVVETACPDCGTRSRQVKNRPRVRVKDLPASGQRVQLWWRKRRLLCLEVGCLRLSFTETTTAIPPRSRLTVRLREQLATAIAGSNRAVVPEAWHVVEQYANNPIESDHGRLKARTRPMRGLKRLRCARVVCSGHAFVQNLRRGHYELGHDTEPGRRLEAIFTELALVI